MRTKSTSKRKLKYNMPRTKASREAIEAELSAIRKMDEATIRLTSAEGFADYYLQMEDLYLTQYDAYERLEEFHISVTGHRRYSDYNSFMRVMRRRFQKPGWE